MAYCATLFNPDKILLESKLSLRPRPTHAWMTISRVDPEDRSILDMVQSSRLQEFVHTHSGDCSALLTARADVVVTIHCIIQCGIQHTLYCTRQLTCTVVGHSCSQDFHGID